MRHTAIGLNYIDTYHRSGLYPGALPLTPGLEGAGTVEAVGPGVTDVRPGQRVAYVMLDLARRGLTNAIVAYLEGP